MDLIRQNGHEAALFSMADPRGTPTPYDRYFVSAADFKNRSHSLWQQVKLAGRAIYSWEARLRLREMIADFRPDVAHIRNIYHHLSPSILWELKAKKIPVIYHLNDFKLICPNYNFVSRGKICERCSHGKFWNVVTEGCYAGGRTASLALATEAFTHRWLGTYKNCVDTFLAPSQFVKNKLVANGWDEERVEVLPHFQRVSSNESSRLSEEPFILYFGRLSPEKGLEDLLQAMSQLPSIKLLIAGEGAQKEELVRLSERLLLKNIEFTGHLHREGLEKIITQAKFTVFPSRAYETLGKSILESYACGRAVVASDLGSRRELVQDGRTGFLYPPGDINALVRALSCLWHQPKLAEEMGKNGREFVQNNHAPKQHYESLIGLYRKLAPTRPELAGKAISRPLKIAFVGGRGVISKYSGIETYYEQIGSELTRMGHEVTVYCHSYFTPRQRQHAGMRLVRLPTIRSKHLETLIHTFLSTIHTMFRDYDIVHFHALGPALFSFAPRMAGKKTAVTIQGLDWQRKKWGMFASSILKIGERAAITFPDATMVVSKTLHDYYKKRFRADSFYIPNGTALRQKQAIFHLPQWGLTAGQYILFLGRFSPEKNCHILIQAYEQLHSHVKLVLAGGSSHSDKYVSELKRHQSADILLLDWVSGSALDELLTNAMLFVLPSDLEGLSLALLDAMGAGVCVLASDIPENREMIKDAGFTFRCGDVNDLTKKMQTLISRPDLRHSFSRLAKKRIALSYQWPKIAKQVEQVYLALVSNVEIQRKIPPKPEGTKRVA